MVKQSSAVVRLLELSRVGWRKVATGAAALLALAMGYHVIFGQNGLTVYQQKRQDSQSLIANCKACNGRTVLLKGPCRPATERSELD